MEGCTCLSGEDTPEMRKRMTRGVIIEFLNFSLHVSLKCSSPLLLLFFPFPSDRAKKGRKKKENCQENQVDSLSVCLILLFSSTFSAFVDLLLLRVFWNSRVIYLTWPWVFHSPALCNMLWLKPTLDLADCRLPATCSLLVCIHLILATLCSLGLLGPDFSYLSGTSRVTLGCLSWIWMNISCFSD